MDQSGHPNPADHDDIVYHFISCNVVEEHEVAPQEVVHDSEESPITDGLPTKMADTQQVYQSKTIPISTTFNHYAHERPDMTLISSDEIQFYVHRKQLLEASDAYWSDLLVTPTGSLYPSSLRVAEDSPTLNVVLHVIYRLSLQAYSPDLLTILAAINALRVYGIPLKSNVSPGMPLYDELVVQVPFMPIEVYAIAAENDLFEPACEASRHLLSFKISSLTDEIAFRLGPVYLCMLYNLLIERVYVLRRLVIQPPDQHAPTALCGSEGYRALQLEWSKLASAMILSGGPDTSPDLLYATFRPLNFSKSCPSCIQSIERRAQNAVSKWSMTPDVICRDTQNFRAVLSSR